MSGSGKKRSSKWDLRDNPDFSPDDGKQLRSGWSSAGDKLKHFSGGRGSNKDNIMNKDYRVLDSTMEWDEDESYDHKMSPGLDAWKHKRHNSQSPKNGWSRSVSRSSRSRSPPHGFRWDSGVNDRSRMRAGGSTQPCRDFAAGKCRRGSHCHFLHDNQNHEDGWEDKYREDGAPRYSAPREGRDYSLKSGRSDEACINFPKGRCRMGASCKFVHHNNSDGHSKVSVDGLTREREIDRRHRDSSFEQGSGHGPNRGDTLCKFFANESCRNGKYCRFSHDRQACRSHNRRLRDDRWASNPGGDYHMLDRPKLSDSVSPNRRPRGDRWGSDGNKADADKVWDSPKRNDTVAVSDTAKLVEDKSENVVAAEQGFTPLATRDGWGHSLDKSRVHGEQPFSSDKKEADSWITGNNAANMHGSQSIGTDIWLGDDAKMSPDWDYRVRSSSCIEEKHEQNKHGITQGFMYLDTSEHDRIQIAPGQGFNQNAVSFNSLHSSSCQAVGQSQVAVPILPSKGGIVDGMLKQEVSTEKKYTAEPNIMDAGLSQVSSRNPPPTANVVGKEQLAQLTNLSASLAHILGTGQQLPQLYAALNSHDAKDISSLAKTEVPAMPVSNTFIRPDPTVGLLKQYDPMCDSVEPKGAVASGVPPAIPPSQKVADVVEIPSQSNTGRQNCGDSSKAAGSEELVKSDPLIQLQPGQNTGVNKDNNKEMLPEETLKSKDDPKSTKESGPFENMEQTDGPDEAKKIKGMKGNRAFKFALVEFVKELLKPTWKDGQITKEDYKTIVKKVVDKVTGSMQGVNIPQTQEKIDHYLSFSKPKLNKLVQAYVEKVQKA